MTIKYPSRRNGLVAMAAVAVAVAMPLMARAQAPIVIKFSHVVAQDTPKGKAAEYFKKLADERTKGNVKVEVYHNSALYKDKEEMEALQLGAVQMLAPSLAKFGPLGVKEFEVFDLPFVFDSYADLHKVTYGPVGKGLLKKLEPKGIIGLGLLGQRLQGHERQQTAEGPGRLQGPEDAHPVVQGARSADAGSWGDSPGDGVLRGLPGAADRRSATAPRIRPPISTPRRCTKCRNT